MTQHCRLEIEGTHPTTHARQRERECCRFGATCGRCAVESASRCERPRSLQPAHLLLRALRGRRRRSGVERSRRARGLAGERWSDANRACCCSPGLTRRAAWFITRSAKPACVQSAWIAHARLPSSSLQLELPADASPSPAAASTLHVPAPDFSSSWCVLRVVRRGIRVRSGRSGLDEHSSDSRSH